jgi:hypothetical protein
LTDEVIALLNDQFIPLAPGWGAGDGPKAKEYEWWQEVRRANNKIKGLGIDDATVPGTMFWVATAAGQRVPAHKAPYSKQAGLAPTLRQVLRLYAGLPEPERRPDKPIEDANRPRATPPPGGLVLVSYDRPLMRDSEGKYHKLTGRSAANAGNLLKHIPWQPGAQLDALWLTRTECQALMPENPRQGQTISVPAALTRRIGLYGLTVRSAWQEMYHWQPDSVRQADLKLTVETVSTSAVQMRLHGSILLSAIKKNWRPEGGKEARDIEDRYDARLEGRLAYDPVKKRVTRWDMVALGDYVGFSQAHLWGGKDGRQQDDYAFAKEPVAIGMSFEIDNNNYELPAEYRRSIPFLLWWFGDRGKDHDYYFDPQKWEVDWRKQNKK